MSRAGRILEEVASTGGIKDDAQRVIAFFKSTKDDTFGVADIAHGARISQGGNNPRKIVTRLVTLKVLEPISPGIYKLNRSLLNRARIK
jgi:hypothetical protein